MATFVSSSDATYSDALTMAQEVETFIDESGDATVTGVVKKVGEVF